MRLLFIGDIVGQPGRRAVRALVPRLREDLRIDVVVANVENAAGGSGITPRVAEELFTARIDVMTTGDHLWDHKEVTELLVNEPRFLRPLNYPPETVGRGGALYELPGLPPFAVANVQGLVFMPNLDNPFRAAREAVARLRESTPIILVDFHAEATSEKIGLARCLDGQVSAVIGTHTHVQTADEQIFPGGTAFLCDAGFTGPHESVIGRDIEPVVRRFMTNLPQRFTVAKESIRLQGALVDVEDATGKATAIRRVSETWEPTD